MNILHLVSGELTGGAARGAYWLHKALSKSGVHSRILNKSPGGQKVRDADIEVVPNTGISRLKEKAGRFPVLLYRSREKRLFHTGLTGFNFLKSDSYKWADIIHLHWINNGFVDIKSLAKTKKPVVWTMRDMWPMTGGCHYSMDCNRYTTGCGSCPQLHSKRSPDLSSYVVQRKARYISTHVKLVGISHWLCECARNSLLYRDFDVRMIHNGIDISEYTPASKESARSGLKIDTNKKIVLIGAQNTSDFYKGFDKFMAAARLLDKDKVFLLMFGESDLDAVGSLGIEYRSLGFLYDTSSLKEAYSAADVFVAPSLMDAFGKTLAESLACGTPVVCFDATGPKDIVDHKTNGYRATPFEHEDLAAGIMWVLADTERHRKLCLEARKKAETSFNIDNIAMQYSDLYQTLLSPQRQ
jgi:glycosyltransferase involved in cell wall biosynthesis